jgi:hypothetical protein
MQIVSQHESMNTPVQILENGGGFRMGTYPFLRIMVRETLPEEVKK